MNVLRKQIWQKPKSKQAGEQTDREERREKQRHWKFACVLASLYENKFACQQITGLARISSQACVADRSTDVASIRSTTGLRHSLRPDWVSRFEVGKGGGGRGVAQTCWQRRRLCASWQDDGGWGLSNISAWALFLFVAVLFCNTFFLLLLFFL